MMLGTTNIKTKCRADWVQINKPKSWILLVISYMAYFQFSNWIFVLTSVACVLHASPIKSSSIQLSCLTIIVCKYNYKASPSVPSSLVLFPACHSCPHTKLLSVPFIHSWIIQLFIHSPVKFYFYVTWYVPVYLGLLGPAWCKLFSVILLHFLLYMFRM